MDTQGGGVPPRTGTAAAAAVLRAADPLRAVLDVLRTRGPLTRAEIGASVGLSRSTVSGLLGDLKRGGLTTDVSSDRPSTGRPATRVALNRFAGLAVGVDVGRRHLRVVVADAGHLVLAERVDRFAVDDRPRETFAAIADLLDGLLEKLSAVRGDVLAIGLGIPAPLDAQGTVGSSSILPGWLGLVPAAELAAELRLPVRVDNDANLGALAEAVLGAGRGCHSMVYVKAATGIGAGIVHDGQVLRGASGTAGELGHMTIVVGGELCRCGNRGCLETYIGGPALVSRLEHVGVKVTGVPDIVGRAQAGDPACIRVLSDAGDQAGQALADVVNLLNPERVVLGGDLGLAGELVLANMRARVMRAAVPAAAARASVLPGMLGDRAEALGSLLLVLRDDNTFADALQARVVACLGGQVRVAAAAP